MGGTCDVCNCSLKPPARSFHCDLCSYDMCENCAERAWRNAACKTCPGSNTLAHPVLRCTLQDIGSEDKKALDDPPRCNSCGEPLCSLSSSPLYMCVRCTSAICSACYRRDVVCSYTLPSSTHLLPLCACLVLTFSLSFIVLFEQLLDPKAPPMPSSRPRVCGRSASSLFHH